MSGLSLKTKYEKEVAPVLAREFDLRSKMSIPKIEKIVVNMGVGDAARDKARMEVLKTDMAAITGLAPSVRGAKLSVAGFNIREGLPIGLKVTLRREKMYDFLTRLLSVVLPRFRDFRGVPLKSFDQKGNYTLGISDHSVFPEIDIGKSGSHGLEITIVTTAENREMSKKLLELMGMPFEKE